MSVQLTVPHGSIRKHAIGFKPKGMVRMHLEVDQREFVEELAASIFADMASAAYPFHMCLAAVYLSGMQHARECKDRHLEQELGKRPS